MLANMNLYISYYIINYIVILYIVIVHQLWLYHLVIDPHCKMLLQNNEFGSVGKWFGRWIGPICWLPTWYCCRVWIVQRCSKTVSAIRNVMYRTVCLTDTTVRRLLESVTLYMRSTVRITMQTVSSQACDWIVNRQLDLWLDSCKARCPLDNLLS